MVQDFDLEQLTGADQVARHFNVRFGRGGVAARMVMRQNDGGGSARNGALEDFTRMNQQRVECPLRYRLPADQASAGVEQHDLKILHLVNAILLAKKVGDAGRSIEQRRFAPELLGHPARQGKSALQRNGFVAPDPSDLAEVFKICSGEVVKCLKCFEKLLGNAHCRGAFGASPQQDGDQFRVAKSVSAAQNEPFAGTLMLRQVPDQ